MPEFRPSELIILTLEESEMIIGPRIRQLEKDFVECTNELPMHKRRIADNPGSSRQELIDFAFSFFVAGLTTALDRKSHFNFDRTELEHRRDLN